MIITSKKGAVAVENKTKKMTFMSHVRARATMALIRAGFATGGGVGLYRSHTNPLFI